MAVGRFLVDVSALAQYPQPEVAERLDELHTAGVVVTCSLMELILLGAARDAQTYAGVAALRRASVDVLEMTEADVRRALEVQGLLVERGELGVPWPALLVAAVAERHGVVVLHCNTVFDLIAKVTEQGAEWVVERSGLRIGGGR